MKKITKKQEQAFNARVLEIIGEYEHTVQEGIFGRQEYVFNTELGTYTITRIEAEAGSSVYSVFGRFEDADLASKATSCNPYSGKHNFHSFNAFNVQVELIGFMARFAWPIEQKEAL
jgi:tRNA U38,U39,U40 pseudouridine synthase TruA